MYRLVRLAAALGSVLAAFLLIECLLVSRLGLNGTIPMLYVAAILTASFLLIIASRKATAARKMKPIEPVAMTGTAARSSDIPET